MSDWQQIPCPTCNGEGIVTCVAVTPLMEAIRWEGVPCPICKGQSKVMLPVHGSFRSLRIYVMQVVLTWESTHKSEILTAVSAVLMAFAPAEWQPVVQTLTVALGGFTASKYQAHGVLKAHLAKKSL